MKMADALFTYRGFYSVREVTTGDYYMDAARATHKYETTINNIIKYNLRYNSLSHMSLQGFAKFLKAENRDLDKEPSYYPFTLEFEPKLRDGEEGFIDEYRSALIEAKRFYMYLKYNLVEDAKDIALIITPGRSIYVMINPKIFNVKQATNLHTIYREMFKEMNDIVDLNMDYVDSSFFKAYQLIKTPNSFYNGGYVVPIYEDELNFLIDYPELKNVITRNKRNINSNVWDMPCSYSAALEELYLNIKENIGFKKQNTPGLSYLPECLNYYNNLSKDEVNGKVNFLLTANAIVYKNLNYDKKETIEQLTELASKWKNDEVKNVKSIVNTVYRKNTNFSCSLLKDNLNCSCLGCPYKKGEKNEGFTINSDVIKDLIKNKKANKRHYIAYLLLCRNDLFNKNITSDVLKELKINLRTVQELLCLTGYITLKKENDSLIIENKSTDKNFILPFAFVDDKQYEALGCRLKHYLSMFCLAWRKAPKKKTHIYFKLNRKAAMDLLGYKSESSFYKMIKDLEDMYLIEHIGNDFIRVYFKSYKVISIKNKPVKNEDKKVKINNRIINKREQYIAVSGFTYSIINDYKVEYMKHIERDFSNKGSPG